MMGGVRVFVDLSEYFQDHRQKSLIFVERNCIKSVQNLINHICKIFCLVDNFEIFILDAHVPRSECAEIFQDGDVVRVSKLTNQPDLSESSLGYNKSKNNNVTLDDDNISPRVKRKRRKEHKCEASNKEQAENLSESQRNCPTHSSEPRKKRKKKPVTDSKNGGCEATSNGQPLECESKKGKKKTPHHDPKEWPKYILDEKNACNRNYDLESSLDPINEISIEPVKMQECTLTAENDQVTVRDQKTNSDQHSINSGDVLICSNADKSILSSSMLESQVAIDSHYETFDGSIGSGLAKKRRRERRRKRNKKRRSVDKHNFNVSKVLSYKPVHSFGESLVPRRSDITANNSHVRFSDEEEGKVNQTPKVVELDESKKLDSARANSFNLKDSLEVNDSSISIQMEAEDIATHENSMENGDIFPKKTDVTSVDCGKRRQICHGKNSSSDGHVISENDNNCQGHYTNCKSVIEESVAVVERNNDSSACAPAVPSEDSLSKPGAGANVVLSGSKRNRRREMIIAKGLGATLTYLMKESNKSNNEGVTLKNNSSESPVTLNKDPSSDLKPTKSKKDRRYDGFPILENFPRKDDILAFKVLKLNERYEPTVSGYLEGKVTDFDDASTLVMVKVLGGAEELKKVNGKFDLDEVEDDCIVIPENENLQEILQLQWSEFIEPRLVFP